MLWAGRLRYVVVLAGVLARTAVAAAQGAPPPAQSPPTAPAGKPFKSGWRVALELGGAGPFGAATSSHDLAALIAPPVVFGFDAAFRPLRRFDFGLTSTLAIGTARGPRCPEPSAGCTLSIAVLGLLRARYHFSPLGKLEPWAGLGAGIDFLTNEGHGSDYNYYHYSLTDYYLGPVLGAAHAGFGYRLTPTVSFGLTVDAALARYLSVKRQVHAAESPPYHATSPSNLELIHSSPQRRIDSPAHVWLIVKGHVTFDTPQ